jgi:peptide-methionine (R)-S-oxide reductase
MEVGMTKPHERSEQEWRELLTPEAYRVMREKGTEAPFSGALCGLTQPGIYRCAGCGTELFRSTAKYDSGSGWPSFFEPTTEGAIEHHEDRSHGMIRTEVTCAACEAHLGHVFPDGPPPTGLRYCINSVALTHEPED